MMFPTCDQLWPQFVFMPVAKLRAMAEQAPMCLIHICVDWTLALLETWPHLAPTMGGSPTQHCHRSGCWPVCGDRELQVRMTLHKMIPQQKRAFSTQTWLCQKHFWEDAGPKECWEHLLPAIQSSPTKVSGWALNHQCTSSRDTPHLMELWDVCCYHGQLDVASCLEGVQTHVQCARQMCKIHNLHVWQWQASVLQTHEEMVRRWILKESTFKNNSDAV